jgi:uncharacterized protein YegP (UPF0339 family)
LKEFEISMGEDQQFYINFKTSDSIILKGIRGYNSLKKCLAVIKEIKRVSQYYFNFKCHFDGVNYYFILVSSRNVSICRSKNYSSTQARDDDIEFIKLNAPLSIIKNLIFYEKINKII